jgi:hypothetical protein
MPKQLRDYWIYLAPQIRGKRNSNGGFEVYDERTGDYLNPNDIDDKIIIYERQVKEWFLNRASRLLRGKNNGFIILMIAISYIEGNEEYRAGESSNRRSNEFFKRGMQRIFSIEEHPDQLNDFYNQVRCGLFHSGMTRNKVIINREQESLTIDFSEINVIKINYKKFYHKVRKDFEGYLKILKNQRNSAEKTNFNQMFSNLVNM